MTKPFEIPKALVWKAFQRVKANGGSAGIDQESIEEFERNLSSNLYKLWNRMASGSYFCPRPSRLGELLRSILCLGAESVVETRQRVSDSMDAAKVQAPAPPQVTGRAAAFQTRSLWSKGVCALGMGDFPRRIGDGSRMSREVHVRFCEGLGLKCPGLLTCTPGSAVGITSCCRLSTRTVGM